MNIHVNGGGTEEAEEIKKGEQGGESDKIAFQVFVNE